MRKLLCRILSTRILLLSSPAFFFATWCLLLPVVSGVSVQAPFYVDWIPTQLLQPRIPLVFFVAHRTLKIVWRQSRCTRESTRRLRRPFNIIMLAPSCCHRASGREHCDKTVDQKSQYFAHNFQKKVSILPIANSFESYLHSPSDNKNEPHRRFLTRVCSTRPPQRATLTNPKFQEETEEHVR